MRRRRVGIWSLCVALVGAGAASSAGELALLGEAVVASRMEGVEAPVGGLSGLAFDRSTGAFFAVSDDPSRFAPARIYQLAVDLAGGVLRGDGVRVAGVTTLRRADGTPFPPLSLDAESLARTPEGNWVVASEGQIDRGVAPALLEFSPDGAWIGSLRLPRWLRPKGGRGPRHNLALESVTVSPGGQWLFSATESALRQDGEVADATAGSLCRIVRYSLPRRRAQAAFAYRTEPIAAAPRGEEFAVNGLVDLLALDERRLLALERSFTAGQGNVARLFLIDLAGATDVLGWRRLDRASHLQPVRKRLLLDVGELGVTPDNLEAMALGPELEDGRATLLLVADDNFAPARQRSQVIALGIPPRWRDEITVD